MTDENEKQGLDLTDLHPNCGPLIEAALVTKQIPHEEQLGCLVILFRGSQFRLIMDDSLNLYAVAEVLDKLLKEMREQKPTAVDPDKPLDEAPKLQ